MTRRPRLRLALVKPPPVLITESADQFSRLRDALKDEFKPHGAVEEFMVEEIAALSGKFAATAALKQTYSILPIVALWKTCLVVAENRDHSSSVLMIKTSLLLINGSVMTETPNRRFCKSSLISASTSTRLNPRRCELGLQILRSSIGYWNRENGV